MSSADLQLRPQSLTLKLPLHQESSSSSSCRPSDESECVTPTSPEHRIPTIIACPPPPKKQRHLVPSCKRKLSEFQFFEAIAGDEIDSFFKSSYDQLISKNSSARKRKVII